VTRTDDTAVKRPGQSFMKIIRWCALGLGMVVGAHLGNQVPLTPGACRAILPLLLATLASLLTWRTP
jgi:hypothetical protein